MSDTAKLEDNEVARAPFQIKSFSIEIRNLALRSSRKQGLTMGEWMERAVQTQARLEDGENIFPPRTETLHDGAAVVRQVDQVFAVASQLRDLMQASAAAAEASGRPMPARAAGRFHAFVDDQIRAVSGLPPRKPRKTILQIGKTGQDV